MPLLSKRKNEILSLYPIVNRQKSNAIFATKIPETSVFFGIFSSKIGAQLSNL